jgi:hypothetical protein
MAAPIRRTDITESLTEKGLYWSGATLLGIIVGFLIWNYSGRGTIQLVIWLLISIVPLFLAISQFSKASKVPRFSARCPYCNGASVFIAPPTEDFTCIECHRKVAVDNGRILSIIEVKCGFCGSLQRFSERTEVALCEECNHEIPLASSETGQMKHLAKGMAVEEDPRHYDLILIAPGGQLDPLLNKLQSILALNRNQVKELLNTLPTTLLTGIPKRKATLLQEQLKEVGAATDVKLTPGK